MNKPVKLCVIAAVLLLAAVCLAGTAAAGDSTPNDPRYSEQWALQNMQVPEAWTYTTGSDKVVVAVIDSGVNYNHKDIIANMWTNPGEIPDNGIDDDKNGYVDDYYGYDFADNTSDPVDNNGHGTHVAGVLGAVGNNGIGISGVSQKVSIMALRVENMDGILDGEAIARAIKYAADMGAKVINISSGGYSPAPDELNAVRYAAGKGVLIVACAGNDAEDTDAVKRYPASIESPNILSVAALDGNDSLTVYSNYGSFTVDVAAPGGGYPEETEGILSLSSTDNNEYLPGSGTSIAAPMVAGLAVLLLAENPELTAVDLKCIIMATVTPDAALKGKVVSGGKVNAGEALRNAVHNKYHMVTFSSPVKKEGSETMTEIGSQVVEDGKCITEPENPSKYFMQFDGWYTESGTKWDFSTRVTEDVNLYAHWVEDTSLPLDTSWYTPEQTEYHISTAAQLLGLSKIVYDAPFDMDDPATYAFLGKTVTLDNDISLAGINWIPIGVANNNSFDGTFNGNGKKITGLSVNLPKENYVGLFGTNLGKITSLTLEASDITGYNFVGTLCGMGYKMDHVHVTVNTVNGHNGVGGLMGFRPYSESAATDTDITVIISKAMYVDAIYPEGSEGSAVMRGAGGAVGWGAGNNITVQAGDIICTNPGWGGYYIGGAFGYAPSGFHDVSVAVSSITGIRGVGGIAGYAAGDISNCSAIIDNITTKEGGAAIGHYYPNVVSRTASGTGNTITDVFASVSGNATGAIGYVAAVSAEAGESYKLTIENVLITGNLSDFTLCGGIVGEIVNFGSAPVTVSIRNCVSLPRSISSPEPEITGRIYGTISGDAEVSVADNYAWEGTVNSSGEPFEPSDKNGENVASSEVWNNLKFFENLGWNFTGVWKMNAGNDNFMLPVLENTLSTGKLNALYLLELPKSYPVENEKGASVEIETTGESGSIYSVVFVDAPGESVTLSYTKHSPEETTGLKGKTVGYQFDLSVSRGGEKITSSLNTEVTFYVSKSDLAGVSLSKVKLAHWISSENRWEYLDTRVEADEGDKYRFTAKVTGFSPFAVVVKADEPVKSSSSVTAFFGTKDGSDFTFKKAVVITEATIPGASYATVINTSGSGWYTCSLSTDGTNGTVYFQVPLDVIDIKGWTVNDVSMLGCRTTYLSSDDQYAYYSAIIMKGGAYTIDFEKDAAQKAITETKTVTETKPVETPVTTPPVTTEKPVTTETPTPTAAKTPFPVLGILAGLGAVAVLVMRRH